MISSYYSIDQAKVVFENFDDEIVLINLENGNYFSIRGTASIICNKLLEGLSIETIIENLAKTYKVDKVKVMEDIYEFITQMEKEELISPNSTPVVHEINIASIEIKENSYATPKLEIYTDMQDLILLDPIHEVDETGWPNIKEEDQDKKKIE